MKGTIESCNKIIKGVGIINQKSKFVCLLHKFDWKTGILLYLLKTISTRHLGRAFIGMGWLGTFSDYKVTGAWHPSPVKIALGLEYSTYLYEFVITKNS